jgi:general secretion pathway protein H
MGARDSQRGYTLIEILVVLAILVFVVAGASLGIGSLTRANLRSASVMVGAAVRTGYARAVTQGHAVRLVLDITAQRMWLEETDDRLVLSRNNDDSAAGASQSDADGGTPEAEQAAAPASTFTLGASQFKVGESNTPRYRGAQFRHIEGSRFEPRDMPRGVKILAVYTAHTEGRQEEGTQYLYFWPGGMTERAVVQLADKDDGTTYSIVVHPLTGRTRIETVPVEPEADLADESEQPEEARDESE